MGYATYLVNVKSLTVKGKRPAVGFYINTYNINHAAGLLPFAVKLYAFLYVLCQFKVKQCP